MSSTEVRQSPATNKSAVRIIEIVVVALAVVIGVGLLIRRLVAMPSTPAAAKPAAATGLAPSHTPAVVQKPGFPTQNPPEVAAKAAKEILEKLKSDPNNFDLLTKAGNIYVHSRVFSGAIDYYQKALQVKDDPTVRNDYGNAMFYSGDVDGALQQYETILKADPGNANALFNRGMVRWRGKHDPQGAVESWKMLLTMNPKDPRRASIRELISQAQRHPVRPR